MSYTRRLPHEKYLAEALVLDIEEELCPFSFCPVQVLLGENKPLWMALIPAPEDAFLGVFVKFDELWVHSIADPSKGLLKKVRKILLLTIWTCDITSAIT